MEGTKLFGGSYSRSQDIYFEDGNIVLVAENTAFRVHKGLLARRSEIFRDMLTIVSQPRDAETFDGCPVVRLSDRRTDLAALLSALYDIPGIGLKDFDALAGVLRLSTKYIIDTLREHALDALLPAYPSTLEAWDSYEGKRPDPALVISLARETGATILLPSTFYQLCRVTSDKISDVSLSLSDIHAFYKGKEAVATAWPLFLMREWNGIVPWICHRQSCRGAYDAFATRERWHALRPSMFRQPDPLDHLKSYIRALENTEAICFQEKRKSKKSVEKNRADIWSDLPKIFGLGTWAELKRHF